MDDGKRPLNGEGYVALPKKPNMIPISWPARFVSDGIPQTRVAHGKPTDRWWRHIAFLAQIGRHLVLPTARRSAYGYNVMPADSRRCLRSATLSDV